MKIKNISTKKIGSLRYIETHLGVGHHQVRDHLWIEGVDLLGYWKEGDSYVFEHGGNYVCISKGFLKELLKDE